MNWEEKGTVHRFLHNPRYLVAEGRIPPFLWLSLSLKRVYALSRIYGEGGGNKKKPGETVLLRSKHRFRKQFRLVLIFYFVLSCAVYGRVRCPREMTIECNEKVCIKTWSAIQKNRRDFQDDLGRLISLCRNFLIFLLFQWPMDSFFFPTKRVPLKPVSIFRKIWIGNWNCAEGGGGRITPNEAHEVTRAWRKVHCSETK